MALALIFLRPLGALSLVIAASLFCEAHNDLNIYAKSYDNRTTGVSKNITDTLPLAKINGRWEFLNADGSTIVVPIKKYEAVGQFHSGIAPVSDGKKWGFINSAGIEIVSPKYDRTLPRQHGLTAVKLNEKWGLVNMLGEEIVEPKYKHLGQFYEQKAWVYKNGKGGYIDTTGKEVIPLIFDKVYDFSEGKATAKKDGKIVVIDETGNIEARLDYEELEVFRNGLAPFTKGGKTGFINSKFKEVIPPVYDHYVYPWPNGNIAVKNEEGWAILRADGKKLKKLKQPYLFIHSLPQYSGLPAQADIAMFHNKDLGLYGLINAKGEEVVPAIYDYISPFSNYRRLVVSNRGQYGVINLEGKIIVPLKYAMIDNFHEGLASVLDEDNMKRAYIDTNGVEVIQIPYRSVPANFTNGMAWITVTEGWFQEGAIDNSGELIMPYFSMKYQACGIDKFLLTGGGKKGIFYSKEKKHTRLVYDEIADPDSEWVMVMQNGKWGWIDHSGRQKIPCQYDAATPFDADGWATVLQDGKQFRIKKEE